MRIVHDLLKKLSVHRTLTAITPDITTETPNPNMRTFTIYTIPRRKCVDRTSAAISSELGFYFDCFWRNEHITQPHRMCLSLKSP